MCATDGDQAWEILHSFDPPSLIILDWMMPGMSGPEIASRLRAEGKSEYIYIIILTARAERQDLFRALESGADEFIAKPIETMELQMRVRSGERIARAGMRLSELNRQLTIKHEVLEELNNTLDQRVMLRTAQLEEALKTAENSTHMKSNFLANMSHEIRTPLNGIVSYVELLLMSHFDDEQRSDLMTIRTSVFHLRTIINDILDFSKIEANRMVIDHSKFCLLSLINETLDILNVQFIQNDLEFVLKVQEDLPRDLIGDRVRVQQVLTNLLSNSIKFSSKGGAVILFVEKQYDMKEKLGLCFSVVDCGIGIAPDKHELIFRSFSQADNSTTRRFGGTGLGLAICKNLVELMDGRIWLESRLGVGTAFHVSIPFDVPREQNKAATSVSTNGVTPSPRVFGIEPSDLNILLAEDNIVNQVAMRRVLESVGFNVTAVDNGRHVLDRLSESNFDVVLLDIQMPLMGGVETTRRIRAGEIPNSEIPIIALTGNCVSGNREHYMAIGMNGFVSKPIEYGELYKIIGSVTVSTAESGRCNRTLQLLRQNSKVC